MSESDSRPRYRRTGDEGCRSYEGRGWEEGEEDVGAEKGNGSRVR